jgi:hypothetical protein
VSRVIVPHRDAIVALDFMTGWAGGWRPVYRYRDDRGAGPGGARVWWTRAGRSGVWLADAVRHADERYSDEVELGLPEFRRWNGGVGGATVLWAYVTGADQLRRARAFRPLPTLVVQEGSSSRRWLIWWLEEFVRYGALGEANRKLAYALGAVQKHGDPDAFRVPAPGSCLRRGRRKPVPVVCGRLSLESFRVGQVVGRLKEPPAKDAWMGVQS